MSGDAFDNLRDLQLTPEMLAQVKPKPEGKTFQRRKRLTSNFYMAPETWLEVAYKAVGSKSQLMATLRLYRLWHTRKQGTDHVVASNVKLGVSRNIKRRTLIALGNAGLIEIKTSGTSGMAARVKVLGDLK
jgi:hypothetical protein